jgi:tetratricopeptide (TPR) repeat protein
MNPGTFKRNAGKHFRIPFVVLIFISFLFSLSCSEEKISTSQRGYLTPETMCGTVQFSDGCSPKLDTLIAFGIALIHHMTYEDAEYTFDQVIELDKDCFWGYWGKAMTYIHPLWPDAPDQAALEKGFVLSQNALSLAKTDKEKFYAAAIASFYGGEPGKTKPERLVAFRDGWQQASNNLPEDIESRMFYVLNMLATVSPKDKSYDIQREVGAAAEKTLEIIPDHPAGFHYAIHAYDVPLLAPNAIRVAKEYYKIAPEIPHALHMPTHIFTRLGYWQESIDLNSRSAKAAWNLPVGDQISGHYFHALDYLVYAYLQRSEFDEAKKISFTLDTLSSSFQQTPATAYSIAAIPGRIALENQNWQEAANLKLSDRTLAYLKNYPQYEALIYYANGVGAGRSGNPELAEKSFLKLEELQKGFVDNESNKYWIDQLEIQKRVVKAWELYANKEMGKSLEMMIAAADLEDATEKNPVTPGQLLPAREMLGDLYLELNKPKDALKQYELTLEKNPNRFNSLYGAGKSAELIGDKEKAAFYFSAVLKNNKSSEPNNERIAHAVEVTTKI